MKRMPSPLLKGLFATSIAILVTVSTQGVYAEEGENPPIATKHRYDEAVYDNIGRENGSYDAGTDGGTGATTSAPDGSTLSENSDRGTHQSPENALDVFPILGHDKGEGDYIPVKSQPWHQKLVFESQTGEEILQVRVNVEGDTVRYIFFGKKDDYDYINLYEKIDGEKENIIESIPYRDGSGYHFNNPRNLVVLNGNQLHYFIDAEFTGRRYQLGSGLESTQDDFLISNEEWPTSYRSPNGRYEVALFTAGEMDMTLIDLKTGEKRLLLDQPYDGDWSIGQITWKSDSSAFYFDNSGPVACIWKYDITTNELEKIVPEHEATQPYYFQVNGNDFVAYIENHKVKVATPQSH